MDSTKVIKLIRKIIKEEIKKEVKNLVNEVLAEHFIKTLGQSNSSGPSLSTAVLGESANKEVEQKKLLEPEIQKQKLELRQKLIEKITDGNEGQQMFYEDIGEDEVSLARSNMNMPAVPEGAYVDTDDDGIDITQFGFKG